MQVPAHFDDTRRVLLSTAREIYGRLVYSHRTHEAQKSHVIRKISVAKWLRVVAAGLTFIFAALSLAKFGDQADKVLQLLVVVFGAISAAQAVFEKEFVSEKEVDIQRQAAKELLNLREQFLLLIARSYEPSIKNNELQEQLTRLTASLTQAYQLAPDTTEKAYAEAQHALKNEEGMTFSNKEIDLFLPPELRVEP